jgi:hypothetical protein
MGLIFVLINASKYLASDLHSVNKHQVWYFLSKTWNKIPIKSQIFLHTKVSSEVQELSA